MMKRTGPKTDPWGTPGEKPEQSDLRSLVCMKCEV